MRASFGFFTPCGMHILSVQDMAPSFGKTNFRSLYWEFRLAWKISPDQAMEITVSPFLSAVM
jgi:hypothetical protein